MNSLAATDWSRVEMHLGHLHIPRQVRDSSPVFSILLGRCEVFDFSIRVQGPTGSSVWLPTPTGNDPCGRGRLLIDSLPVQSALGLCLRAEGFLCSGEPATMRVTVPDEGSVEAGLNVLESTSVVTGGKEEVCCTDIVSCSMCSTPQRITS